MFIQHKPLTSYMSSTTRTSHGEYIAKLVSWYRNGDVGSNSTAAAAAAAAPLSLTLCASAKRCWLRRLRRDADDADTGDDDEFALGKLVVVGDEEGLVFLLLLDSTSDSSSSLILVLSGR